MPRPDAGPEQRVTADRGASPPHSGPSPRGREGGVCRNRNEAMNRSDRLAHAARHVRLPARLVALLALAAASAGCSKAQIRSQKEEETEKERYPVRTVGEVSTFGNGEPVIVSGVGIVEGLAGTGSPAPVGDMRQMIEHELRKQK